MTDDKASGPQHRLLDEGFLPKDANQKRWILGGRIEDLNLPA